MILIRDVGFNFDGCCPIVVACFSHNYFGSSLFGSNRPFRYLALGGFPQKRGCVAFDGWIQAGLLVGSKCSVETSEAQAHNCSEEEFYFSRWGPQSKLGTLDWKLVDYVRTGSSHFAITFTGVLISWQPSYEGRSPLLHLLASHLGSPYRCLRLNNSGPPAGFCPRLLKNFALKPTLDKVLKWSSFARRLFRCLD